MTNPTPEKHRRQPAELSRPLPTVLLTARLEHGSVLFIWGLRRWQHAVTQKQSPAAKLRCPYEAAGCPSGAQLIDEFLSVLAIGCKRALSLQCVHGKHLSSDERLLLSMLVGLQRGDFEGAGNIARSLLRPRLVSPVLRLASIYLRTLQSAGLSVDVGPQLRVVH